MDTEYGISLLFSGIIFVHGIYCIIYFAVVISRFIVHDTFVQLFWLPIVYE